MDQESNVPPLLNLAQNDFSYKSQPPRRRRITRKQRLLETEQPKQAHIQFQNLASSVPTAQHWHRLSNPSDCGVSVRCEGRADNSLNFYRLDRYGQRRLIHNITIIVKKSIQNLKHIHKQSIMRLYFITWRVKMEYDIRFTYTNQFRYRTRPAGLLRSVFLAWKHLVSRSVQGVRCHRMGVLSLYSMLYHTRQKKLKKYFGIWGWWLKDCLRITQKSFDCWAIYTYKSKLSRCNAVRFVKYLKDMSLDHTYRKRKSRKKFFFRVWRQKTIQLKDFCTKREAFTSWCRYTTILLKQSNIVTATVRSNAQRLYWKRWRVMSLVSHMWSEQSERLLLQYFRRWKRDHSTRLEVGRLLTHCLSLLTVEGSEKTVDEVAGEETGDDLNPSVEEPHERSLISHDDEDMNTVPPTENDMTASLEQSTGLEDENIDHIQKQLFSEEDSVNRRSWHGRSSVDFTHLKMRVSSTHDLMIQYEARHLERDRQKNLASERRKIRNKMLLSGSGRRENKRTRNSKNFDSDYS